MFHLFTLSPFHSFPFSPLKGVSHFSALSPFHLLRAQPFFHLFTLSPFKGAAIFSPFHLFTLSLLQRCIGKIKAHLRDEDALVGWDTRTRTKNDRTRICSVTITPYPNTCFCTAKLLLFSYLPNDLLTFLSLYKAELL